MKIKCFFGLHKYGYSHYKSCDMCIYCGNVKDKKYIDETPFKKIHLIFSDMDIVIVYFFDWRLSPLKINEKFEWAEKKYIIKYIKFNDENCYIYLELI